MGDTRGHRADGSDLADLTQASQVSDREVVFASDLLVHVNPPCERSNARLSNQAATTACGLQCWKFVVAQVMA